MPPEASRQDRYPGGRPFRDDDVDRRLFFGRDLEVVELTNQIISNNLLVLYGKSGMGKTSLLQAGVFARLRQHQLLPLTIRLNQPDHSLLDDFLLDIDVQCKAQGVDHTPGERASLWEYFKTAAFWLNGELQTPTLVIDQAEELFTLRPREGRQCFAKELGQLLRSGLPDAVRERRERGEQITYSEKPPLLNVVLSLREDYLGHLEELTPELPQILEKRFRLTPLSRAAAREAIVAPAALPQDLGFANPAFSYTEEAVEEILDFLTGKDRQIEPFQLQILCHHIESRIRASADKVVQPGVLGGPNGMQVILQQFYQSALSQVHGRRQRNRARTLCEDGLLDENGRRCSLDEGRIKNTYRTTDKTLQTLVDFRVLRKEPRLDSFYYEISHDSLAKPILGSRRWRMPHRQRRRWMVAAVGTAAMTVIAIVLGVFLLEAEKHKRGTERLLGELLWPIYEALSNDPAKRELLETLSTSAIDAYQSMGDEGATDVERNNRGLAYILRGSMRESRGALTDALEDYKTASAQFSKAESGATSRGAYLRNISVAESQVAEFYLRMTRSGDALDHYRKALLAAEGAIEVFTEEEEQQSIHDVAQIQYRLATLYQEHGEFGKAAAALEATHLRIDALERMKADPSEWRADSLWAHIESGRHASERGDFPGALRAYETAQGLAMEALPSESYSATHDLIGAEDRIAEVMLILGRYERSRWLAEHNQLSQESIRTEGESNVYARRNLIAAYLRVGDVVGSGTATFNALVSAPPNVTTGFTLGPDARAALLSASEQYERSRETALEVAKDFPEDWLVKVDIAVATRGLAETVHALGRPLDAISHHREAQQLYESVASRDRGNLWLKHQVIEAAISRSRALISTGDVASAATALHAALQAHEPLARREPKHAPWQVTLADLYEALGDCELLTAGPGNALDEYERAVSLRRELTALSTEHVGWALQLAATVYKLERAQSKGSVAERRKEEAIARLSGLVRSKDENARFAPVAQRAAELILAELQRPTRALSRTRESPALPRGEVEGSRTPEAHHGG